MSRSRPRRGGASFGTEATGFISSDPGTPAQAASQAASAPQSGPLGGWLIERDGSARFVEDISAEWAHVQVPPGQQHSMLTPDLLL